MRISLSATINSVVILSFLDATDLRSDLRLKDELTDFYAYKPEGFGVNYIHVPSRLAFNQAILDLIQPVQKGMKPILHVEFHGDQEKGIQFLNGEFLPWREFMACIRPLNHFSGHNLGVFLAGCHGAHALLTADIGMGACYNFLISSAEPVKAGELYDSTSKFYISVLEDLLLHQAALELPKQLEIYIAEQMYIEGFIDYVVRHSRGAAMQKRREHVLTQLVAVNPDIDISQYRRLIKERLRDYENHFNVTALKFFGARDRYSITYDVLAKMIDKQLDAMRDGKTLGFAPIYE